MKLYYELALSDKIINTIKLMRASSIELTAKKSHYGVDGSGRDSYINFDNGGNYRGYGLEGRGKFELGSYRPNKASKRKSYTGIEGKPLHYVGDGSGRDFYVITNDGGISSKSRKFNFLESLRAPISRKHIEKNDIFMKTNDSWKSKGSTDPQPFIDGQRSLDRRLSLPRRFEDPYSRMRSSFRSSMGFKS